MVTSRGPSCECQMAIGPRPATLSRSMKVRYRRSSLRRRVASSKSCSKSQGRTSSFNELALELAMSGPSPDTYVDGARFAFRDEFEEDIRQDPLSGSAAISPEKLNNKLRCFKVLG